MAIPAPPAGNSALPTVVLIHGAMTTRATWLPQLDGLRGQFRVLAPDLPGYGDSAGPFSFDRAVDQLTDLIGSASGVLVCGISAGATVALRLAIALPGTVRGLILSGPELHTPRPAAALRNAILTFVPAAAITSADSGITKDTARATIRALGTEDARPLLPKVTARTLVLCGSKDRGHLGYARLAASQIPAAELRVIEGAGHLWNTEQPAEFTAAVASWALAAAVTSR